MSQGRLTLYNTRTRRKEAFEPLEPGGVGVYTCGPTVYSRQHLGNLRSMVFADLLVRALRGEGLTVTWVVNVTDVGHLTDDADAGEDKMERAAARSGRRAADIAAEYTALWKEDLRKLHCAPPDILCRATDHIAEQIEMIRKLEAKGVTYRIDDGIYFDTSKFPRYSELAQLDLAGQAGGHRIGDVEGKRNPQDFALWKFPPSGVARQQEWDSPWGRGFPGWHIECAAMSVRYLGERFDVHTGGVDHLPVHHTNEVAEAETALDVHPWVNVWMHEEFLDFQGEKMSKSTGNVLDMDALEARGWLPLAFRYFLLQAHYRKQQTFTDEAMEAADRGYRRLRRAALEVREARGEVDPARTEPFRARFQDAVRDDLNAPRALAVATEVARHEDLAPPERHALLEGFDAWLGLGLLAEPPPGELEDAPAEEDPRIDALLAEREEARRRRDFASADRIRDELAAEGVAIEDTPQGPRWRRS